jgi:hypothetical protein
MRFIALPLLFLALFALSAGSRNQLVSSDLPNIDTTRGFLEICATADKNLEGHWSQEDIYKAGLCLGWITGFTNGIHVGEDMHRVNEKNFIFCPPVGNSYAQMVHIIKKFIADHPEIEHKATGAIAGAALGQAFPCKESR